MFSVPTCTRFTARIIDRTLLNSFLSGPSALTQCSVRSPSIRFSPLLSEAIYADSAPRAVNAVDRLCVDPRTREANSDIKSRVKTRDACPSLPCPSNVDEDLPFHRAHMRLVFAVRRDIPLSLRSKPRTKNSLQRWAFDAQTLPFRVRLPVPF